MKKVNFLIIEDNVLDYQICKATLEKHCEYSIYVKNVSSLGAAISEITSDDMKYDIVLLDLNIDDSRGLTTLQVFSKNCSIPIIIYSGISDQDIIDQSVLNGADGYVIKGEDSPEKMVDNINHALVNHKFKTEIKFKPKVLYQN